MQDGVLNLCRVKLRDQQRLAHGPLREYPQYRRGRPFGEAVPRAGNASGGGQPGWILKCKGWESDPNAYIYFITQAPVWDQDLRHDRRAGVEDRSGFATPAARLAKLKPIFDTHRGVDHDQDQVRGDGDLQPARHPCGPILSMKEIAEDASLRATGTIVEVDHPERGTYLTVGNPIKLSDSAVDGHALAAARRAHGRDPRRRAEARRQGDHRDPRLGRSCPTVAPSRGVIQRTGRPEILRMPHGSFFGPSWSLSTPGWWIP